MKQVWITWDIKRDRREWPMYFVLETTTVKAAKLEVQNAQNERRLAGSPHMFHVNVSLRKPVDLDWRHEAPRLGADGFYWKTEQKWLRHRRITLENWAKMD